MGRVASKGNAMGFYINLTNSLIGQECLKNDAA